MRSSVPLPDLPRPRAILLAAAAAVALVFLAFGRSLVQGFAPSDDAFLVVHNLAVRGITPESLRLAFGTYDPELYIPLTLVSFQIDFLIGGLQPWIYHLTNILLHAANALLVMWLMLLLLSRRAHGSGESTGARLAALFTGLLFAVHPLHTEAVAWIAGRKDLLSTFFALLTLIAYVRYRGGARRAYVLGVAAFLLSLLAKMMAVTFPAVLLLLDLLWERRPLGFARGLRRGLWQSWLMLLDKVPFALLSLVFSVIAAGGKERILGMLSIPETTLVAGKSIVFYIGKFLLPVRLSILYPYNGTVTLAKPDFFLPLLGVLALLGGIIFLWKRNREAAFGLLFFLIVLSPTLLHSRKGAGILFAVDRYAYLPSIGLLLLVALVLAMLMRRADRLPREAVWIPASVVLTVFLLLSFRQTQTWDTPDTLYGNVLRLYPDAIDARLSLASVYRQQGKITEAFELLKEGLSFGDDPRLHLHAAFLYAKNGDTVLAKEQLAKARQMDPANPEPVFSLGSLLEQTGDPAGAAEQYRAAVILDPSYVIARVSLARLLLADGQLNGAEEQLREALRWNPSSVEAHVAMARLLVLREEGDAAAAHLTTALAIDAGDGEAKELLRTLRGG